MSQGEEGTNPSEEFSDYVEKVYAYGLAANGNPVVDQEQAAVQSVLANALTAMTKMMYSVASAETLNEGPVKEAFKTGAVAFGHEFIKAIMGYATGPEKALQLMTSLAGLNVSAMIRERGFNNIIEYVEWAGTDEGKQRIRDEARARGILLDLKEPK